MTEDDSASHGGGFFNRWSRLKSAGGDSESESIPDQRVPQGSEVETTSPGKPRSREATDEPLPDLPPIESLNEDSDYTLFLSSRVPEEIRNQALRKLFHLPQFNVTDGLDDFAENFREFSGLGSILTQEMRRALERELAESPAGEPRTALPSQAREKDDLGLAEPFNSGSDERGAAFPGQAASSPGEDSEEPTEDV